MHVICSRPSFLIAFLWLSMEVLSRPFLFSPNPKEKDDVELLLDSILFWSYPTWVLNKRRKCSTCGFSGFCFGFFFFLESKSWGIDVFSKFGIHQYRSFLKVNARCHVTTNISVLPFPYLSFQGQHLILLFS